MACITVRQPQVAVAYSHLQRWTSSVCVPVCSPCQHQGSLEAPEMLYCSLHPAGFIHLQVAPCPLTPAFLAPSLQAEAAAAAEAHAVELQEAQQQLQASQHKLDQLLNGYEKVMRERNWFEQRLNDEEVSRCCCCCRLSPRGCGCNTHSAASRPAGGQLPWC
jgi:hypothetical protein